jgi:hypothetical protein
MTRRSRTAIQMLAGVALATAALAAATVPGDTQESAGLIATQVSGSAFGVQADIVATESIDAVDLEALFEAARNGDSETAEQILAQAGVDVNAPVAQGASVQASVGPVPTVALPPNGGGPFTDSSPGVDLTVGPETLALTGGIDVTTEGAIGRDGFAVSASRVNDFNPDENEILVFIADTLETECSADIASGAAGSTRVVNGASLEGDIPELPAPNTVLIDETAEVPIGDGLLRIGAFLIVNEQSVAPNEITVTGARATFFTEILDAQGNLLASIDLSEVVSQSHCGIVLAPVVEPTFTG